MVYPQNDFVHDSMTYKRVEHWWVFAFSLHIINLLTKILDSLIDGILSFFSCSRISVSNFGRNGIHLFISLKNTD